MMMARGSHASFAGKYLGGKEAGWAREMWAVVSTLGGCGLHVLCKVLLGFW